ncbi:hypothetical protein [Methylobacterium sp. JK268]
MTLLRILLARWALRAGRRDMERSNRIWARAERRIAWAGEMLEVAQRGRA